MLSTEEKLLDAVEFVLLLWHNDVYVLKDILNIPDQITCHNRLVVPGIEGFCILLLVLKIW